MLQNDRDLIYFCHFRGTRERFPRGTKMLQNIRDFITFRNPRGPRREISEGYQKVIGEGAGDDISLFPRRAGDETGASAAGFKRIKRRQQRAHAGARGTCRRHVTRVPGSATVSCRGLSSRTQLDNAGDDTRASAAGDQTVKTEERAARKRRQAEGSKPGQSC